jgi:hypothetical protein
MLDRTLANLDALSSDPWHRGPVSTVAACAAHNVRQYLATENDQKACFNGILVVAKATLPADDAKLGAYVRSRLTALGLL